MPEKKIGAEDLVAHYLRSRGYTSALESFIREAGLPPKVGEGLEQSWTLEHILEEKRLYDLTLKFESAGLDDAAAAWAEPCKCRPRIARALLISHRVSKGPTTNERLRFEPPANVLQTDVIDLEYKQTGKVEQVLLVSTAARKLYTVRLQDDPTHTISELNVTPDSPILSFVVLSNRFIAFTTISGSIFIYDSFDDQIVEKRKDHQKYAIQTITTTHSKHTYIATAGWDSKVLLYDIDLSNDTIAISDPIAIIQLPSVPESIIFVVDEQHDSLYLIIGRRDSTFLHYYEITQSIASSSSTDLPLSGRQNLAPYATMWNAFSPAYISACPRDPSLLAVATNSTPHMKVLLVRLLFPQRVSSEQSSSSSSTTGTAQPASTSVDGGTTAAHGRDVDPREVAAVLAHTNTNVSQTRFSTPVIAWRPDGSGFWVNSEEGTIKGIDRAGKIQATLQGHEYATKVRCLWAGMVHSTSEDGTSQAKEVLVSGGFDQKLLLWTLPEPNAS